MNETTTKTIRGIFIDVKEENWTEIEIEKSLQSYYDLIDCDCIDIVSRKIGGQYFDIICDDEGLCNSPKISAINDMGEPMLVGNLFIVNYDGQGDITSLSDEDIDHVKKFIEMMYTHNYPEGYPMLVQVEY